MDGTSRVSEGLCEIFRWEQFDDDPEVLNGKHQSWRGFTGILLPEAAPNGDLRVDLPENGLSEFQLWAVPSDV